MSLLNPTEINEPKNKQKRFIEKLKSKLLEFFFMPSTSTNTKISKSTNNTKHQNSTGTTTLRRYSNGSFIENSISNYYYGYITNNFIYENDKKSINDCEQSFKSADNVSRLSIDSSKTSCSRSSSIFSEPVIDPVANSNEPKINPFLNRNLTELLSFENFSNFNLIKSHFEPSLETIDDENNFFDVEFMTNYISYVLMDNLNESNYLKENNLNLVPDEPINLLKQIAREIFLQSECEPCGLKGCDISVHIQNETDESPQLLSQFRFEANSYLTTFQLDLILYYESNKLSAGTIGRTSSIEQNLIKDNVRSDSNSKSLKNVLAFRGSGPKIGALKTSSTVYLNSEFYIKKMKLY